MDFDDMLEELGEFGKFQKTTYFLICLPILFTGAISLSYVFTVGVPDYRCLIPECDEAQNSSYKVSWKRWAIPEESDKDQVIDFKADNCEKYVINITRYMELNKTCSADIFDRGRIIKCNEWVSEHFERTIVTDWNLYCMENQWKITLVGCSHFLGILIGSAVFGILADKYGRKVIFFVCIFVMSFFGVIQGISPDYNIFLVFVFVNACGIGGLYPLAFIMGVELVGKKKREMTGMMFHYFYAIGLVLLALVAWLTKDWVYLQIIVSAPPLVCLLYYWVMPESVRWLLANNKSRDAKQIVIKIAKVNKVMVSKVLVDSFDEYHPLTGNQIQNRRDGKTWPLFQEMLKSRKMIIRLLIIYYIWSESAFVFYGLSINATNLSGNKYINFALVSLIELPGYSLAWICILKIGRRKSLILTNLLCGIICTLSIFVSKGGNSWLFIFLFLIGKLGVTAAFGIVYVHTAEMLPTVIRSGGVGTASTIARFGGLLASFVPLLGVYYSALPMLLFGSTAVIAGLLAFFLPETFGRKLPETVEEAKTL